MLERGDVAPGFRAGDRIGQDGRVLLAFHSELDPTAHAAKACEALAGTSG